MMQLEQEFLLVSNTLRDIYTSVPYKWRMPPRFCPVLYSVRALCFMEKSQQRSLRKQIDQRRKARASLFQSIGYWNGDSPKIAKKLQTAVSDARSGEQYLGDETSSQYRNECSCSSDDTTYPLPAKYSLPKTTTVPSRAMRWMQLRPLGAWDLWWSEIFLCDHHDPLVS